uniref:KIB1-4 beta-propeller domain-containing protein n=1 Tax=Brassica campestris TaxID=3711 RepID=M4DQX3_BRACM
MSHFLRQLKLSLRVSNFNASSRCFSSSPIYYVRGAEPVGDGNKETIRIPSLKVPMELLKDMGIIGASHGWIATMKSGVVCLQDDLDLPDTKPKRIPLPPLVTLPHCQTQIVTNVAMSSSSSPDDEDCIVAGKFLGPQLSLCRPAQRDCKWSNIRISDPSFFSSHVMYSKRDEMFSMPASRGHYIGSWDLGRHMKEPKIQMLRLHAEEDQIPKMKKRVWQRLESCCTKQHYLVESLHTDETFMLKWYTQSKPPTLNVWDHFLVLKIDKEGYAVYTKDIGDVCILLSRSEPICIPAKLNRRVQNCVYMLTDHEFAIVSISCNQKFGATPFACSLPYYISKNLI